MSSQQPNLVLVTQTCIPLLSQQKSVHVLLQQKHAHFCRDEHNFCLDTTFIATITMFVASNTYLSRQKWGCICRGKSGIHICVTSTRFSCCDDILVKGRSYMNQSKSVSLMALVLPLKMEGERNVFLSRGEAEIRYCRRIESHDDILGTWVISKVPPPPKLA